MPSRKVRSAVSQSPRQGLAVRGHGSWGSGECKPLQPDRDGEGERGGALSLPPPRLHRASEGKALGRDRAPAPPSRRSGAASGRRQELRAMRFTERLRSCPATARRYRWWYHWASKPGGSSQPVSGSAAEPRAVGRREFGDDPRNARQRWGIRWQRRGHHLSPLPSAELGTLQK